MRFRLVPKSMTLDDLEWPKCTLVEKSFYGAHQKNLNKARRLLSAAGIAYSRLCKFVSVRRVYHRGRPSPRERCR